VIEREKRFLIEKFSIKRLSLISSFDRFRKHNRETFSSLKIILQLLSSDKAKILKIFFGSTCKNEKEDYFCAPLSQKAKNFTDYASDGDVPIYRNVVRFHSNPKFRFIEMKFIEILERNN
jgi:hypothetical protein